MEWTRELVIRGRRPTAKEAQRAARWLLWISNWPEHDGPEMYVPEQVECKNGLVTYLHERSDHYCLDCSPEHEPEVQTDEVWIGLDRTGERVMVPCSREEALEATGWRELDGCTEENIRMFRSWHEASGRWQECYEWRGEWRLDVLEQGIRFGATTADSWVRPIDQAGNYAPVGWGKEGE